MKALPTFPVLIDKVEAWVYRYPLKTPVQTSFGVMQDRPAVLVRVMDRDGCEGWGEIWCNFPACGAEHRAHLLRTVMLPLLEGRAFTSAQQVFEKLTESTAVLAIQSGEPGPMAQTIAGIDLALWDLGARKAGVPLWQFLGGTKGRIQVYASGINPERPELQMQAMQAQGYRSFKLKVGFGLAKDLANVQMLQGGLRAGESLMIDANQAWSLAQACEIAPAFTDFNLGWLEEPIRADRPWLEWQTLRSVVDIPLAAGENIREHEGFEQAIQSKALGVIQPDIAKWGGISGNWSVVQGIQDAGLRFCPHYLGAGIGLLASGHLLAGAGGDGMLEVDSNLNPLRSLLSPTLNLVQKGWADLGMAPGLGHLPDLHGLSPYLR
jgi:D-galactarolactone cycloisomerase